MKQVELDADMDVDVDVDAAHNEYGAGQEE